MTTIRIKKCSRCGHEYDTSLTTCPDLICKRQQLKERLMIQNKKEVAPNADCKRKGQ